MLLKIAATVGISFGDFWGMTPREVETYAGAFAENKKHDYRHSYNMAVITAYLAAKWVWAKRVNVDKYLQNDERPKNKNMTDAQMQNIARALNMQLGGETHGSQT